MRISTIAASLFLAFLLDFLKSGEALQCYKCYSSRSWYDCDKYLRVVECPSNADTCVKMKQITSFQGKKVVQHDRKCYVKSACGDFCKNMKKKTGQWDCVTHCCDTPNCNVAPGLGPSYAVALGLGGWLLKMVLM